MADRDPTALLMRTMRDHGRVHLQVAAMAWAYFDETMDQQRDLSGGDKSLRTLAVCGCVSSPERWEAFKVEWKAALESEHVATFHATDFYAFQKDFEWVDENGARDYARRNKFRDRLISIIVRHVDRIVGHFNQPRPRVAKRRSVKDTYMKGVDDALMGEIKSWAIEEPMCVVFAMNPNMSPWSVIGRFQNLNWEGRLKGCGVFSPDDVPQLQAADFVCHAMLRRYVDNSANEAYDGLVNGMRDRNKVFITSFRASEYSNGGGYYDEPSR